MFRSERNVLRSKSRKLKNLHLSLTVTTHCRFIIKIESLDKICIGLYPPRVLQLLLNNYYSLNTTILYE